ncbi:NAD(P)-dependent oxidoreductase [Aromatoleum bremense]|uniref:NAD-binding protein n=1 Tax=Aromatoleum bremense TaxID=76115 RepID=A0ABX1NSZ1_9RHOO|nr:NAD(P)-dependent oxidoreductase [Aromatoleum bremense]NMG14921.1 NAD-binding protein [Aromatoleum bremense]
MDVGFVGLGVMGLPMARHLQHAGHRLHLWARRPQSVAPFAGSDAVVHDSPAALAAATDVAFSVVTGSADVERLALGADGLIHGARPGWVQVDMSTIAPASARRIAAALEARGAAMLDAPVSGGAQGAQDATLAIMVGGSADVLERLRPLLTCLGRTIVHVGDSGAGQVAKACNQMIMVAAIEACAEAMHLANAHGVDLAAVRSALLGGSAASRVLEVMGERMVRRDFTAGIESRLHHKDFGILMDEAARLGAPLPIAAQVWQQLNALMAGGGGRDDTSSLLRVLEASTTEQSARS